MTLVTFLRAHREAAGLSQRALAERVGVSRQAIVAIEAGRQSPQTTLALHLARELKCRVEDLFALPPAPDLTVLLGRTADSDALPQGTRLAVGRVASDWVAHRLAGPSADMADATLIDTADGLTARARLIEPLDELARNVLVAGCAPLLGNLSRRVDATVSGARMTWLPASSGDALRLLADGQVHMAGLHLGGGVDDAANLTAIRERFPHDDMVMVHLTRWTQGLVTPAGNPLGLHTGADLLRDGLRVARRPSGAGTALIMDRLVLGAGGVPAAMQGPMAVDHMEVGRLVRFGVADTGLAIEASAAAEGLSFIPMIEESFDLVMRADVAEGDAAGRVLDLIRSAGFRADAGRLPGYDVAESGSITTLVAA